MSAPRFTAVLPARIRARWDRLALEQLAQRAAALDVEREGLTRELDEAERMADYWEEQLRRAENEGARFAMTQDGQLYRLGSAEAS